MIEVTGNHFPLFREFMDMYEDELTILSGENKKYHLEGNVLYHTLMVYQTAVLNGEKLLPFVALAHDIGKKRSIKIIDERLMMTGHEGTSTLLILDFIKKYRKELTEYFSEDEIKEALYIINYHGSLWKKSEEQINRNFACDVELLEKLQVFNNLDKSGNISMGDYKKKFFKLSNVGEVSEKENTIFILMGLPGSGKSTYKEKHFSNLESLSRDDILMNYSGEKFGSGKTYNEYWKLLDSDDQSKIDSILQKEFTRLKRVKKDFVVDMTNLGWKTRRKWFSSNYNTEIICFLESFDVIAERNKNSHRSIGK